MGLDILYEDDHLLVVDKPAGVVVHPTYKNKEGTVLDMLPARHWTAGTRPSIVGRLDKLTSGIVVIAKSAAVHAAMQREMASTKTEKAYLAIVYGRVEDQRGAIDLRLRYDPRDRRRIVTVEERNAPDDAATAGWRCVTEFERLSSVDTGLSLLRCQLVTGRRHQIRVHLAARGWPIVGDAQYGEPRWPEGADPALAAALRAFPRQALHAWRVAFDHPATRQRVSIEAPPPRDFEELIAIARLKPRATTTTQRV
jgi:23S rRNA pseudouridine1911/1915/1917 synthase